MTTNLHFGSKIFINTSKCQILYFLKLCLRDCNECDLLKSVDINMFHSRRVTAVINPDVFQNSLLGI